jgi:murein DD-endopeptidase MepM/ murein hydrolase activator NlpD
MAMGRRSLLLAVLLLGLAVPATAQAARPTVGAYAVAPGAPGAPPVVSLRVDEPQVRNVRARLVVLARPTNRVAVVLDMGWVPTGVGLTPSWPATMTLPAGRYLVRLHAVDASGRALVRRRRATGRMYVNLGGASSQTASLPVPGAVLPGGVFPVAGPHVTSAAGSDGSFGAGRPGHVHQGHDIAAAAGTPVVAPVAGRVNAVRDQPSAAGWYVVLDGVDGRSYFFAHCLAGSIPVVADASVVQGAVLCGVGQTGDATGPHLHFEIWPGGWRLPGTAPVDPLPQLLAWGG